VSDEKKAATAAVTAAERAYNSAKKKADAALEKAREAVAASNVAARALVHARSNPALFDDDPLVLVDPDQVNNGVIHNGTIKLGAEGSVSHVTITGNGVSGSPEFTEVQSPQPDRTVVVQPGTVQGAPVADDPVTLPQQGPDPARVDTSDQPEAPPWTAPAQPAAPAAAAPKKRTRKIAAKAPAAEQPPAPTADVEPEDDQPVAYDAAGNPVQYAAPSAPF
jgi:hypothetical protein